MTNAHKILRKYLEEQFPSAILKEVGTDKIAVINEGRTNTFTINLYGDIMDAENGMFVAYSNVPHDMEWLLLNASHIPSSWTNNSVYFFPGSVR